MIAYVQWKECDALAELFERRSDDCILWDDTEAPSSDVSEVSTHYCTFIDDDFAMQDDVLTSTEHGLSIYLIKF